MVSILEEDALWAIRVPVQLNYVKTKKNPSTYNQGVDGKGRKGGSEPGGGNILCVWFFFQH